MAGLEAIARFLTPNLGAFVLAVLLDFVLGDPTYRLHPVRLIGDLLRLFEWLLRGIGLNGYVGGVLLFVALAGSACGATLGLMEWLRGFGPGYAWALHVFLLYSLLALGDLVHHVWRIERALKKDDLAGARAAVSMLVGRDTDRMDAAACRRAGIESLSENLTDGWVTPLLWYALGGLMGLVVYKVVSTMDSMVGFKNERYLRFGWCGARLDDAMNFVPARATWLLIAAAALVVPGASAKKALEIGADQNDELPSPNSGWSEAATAGAIQRRLVGPIWRGGNLVTDIWLGDPKDPPAGERADVVRAIATNVAAGVLAVLLAGGVVLVWWSA